MLRASRVIISLTPDAIEGAVVSGSRVLRRAGEPLDRRAWSQAWQDGLIPFDGALAKVLAAMAAPRGARTTVLAQSPSDVIEVCTYPNAGPQSLQAASLRVAERVRTVDAAPTSAAEVLAHDELEGQSRAHVLAIATDNIAAQAVFGWVSRAGGRFEGYVPRAVVPLALTLRAATTLGDGCFACCYLDCTTAAIASMHSGALDFVRSFNAGYQSLAEAYARGVAHAEDSGRARGPEQDGELDDTPALDMARGTTLLFENGVPSREARIGHSSSPYRLSVAPLLASVMQRLSVEIKQSVRYGVSKIEHRPRRLVLLGPGAQIPGMVSLLSESTELDIEVLPVPAQAELAPGPFEPGSTEHAFACGAAPDVALLPIAAVERLASAQRASALRVGVIVSAGLLLGEAGLVTLERSQVRARTDERQGDLAEIRAEAETRTRAAGLVSDLDLASHVTTLVVGDQPDWSGVLGGVASVTPASVRVREMRAFFDGKDPVLAISGSATDAPGERQGSALGAYIEALNASVLVEQVELGTTRSETVDGVTSRVFSVNCRLRAFPFAVAHPELYAGGPIPEAARGARP